MILLVYCVPALVQGGYDPLPPFTVGEARRDANVPWGARTGEWMSGHVDPAVLIVVPNGRDEPLRNFCLLVHGKRAGETILLGSVGGFEHLREQRDEGLPNCAEYFVDPFLLHTRLELVQHLAVGGNAGVGAALEFGRFLGNGETFRQVRLEHSVIALGPRGLPGLLRLGLMSRGPRGKLGGDALVLDEISVLNFEEAGFVFEFSFAVRFGVRLGPFDEVQQRLVRSHPVQDAGQRRHLSPPLRRRLAVLGHEDLLVVA
mmetsp:Transcript_14323/g.41995  ORF Transcript_14323/g.41995 Transcript_14323/m.41995 type:complete len:259 (+) Transcript_14323:816-1592(+)